VTPGDNPGGERENTLDLVTEAEAPDSVRRVCEEIKAAREGDLEEDLSLRKLWLLFGNDPELVELVWGHIDYGYNGGSLPFELKSKVSLVVATVMRCEGCRFFHESALDRLDVDLERLREIDLSEREILELFDCIAFHVYTAYVQAMAGVVRPGMSREEWTQPVDRTRN